MIILALTWSQPCLASQPSAYHRGSVSAKAHQHTTIDLLNQGDLSRIPGFTGEAPYEMSLDHGSMGENALHVASSHPASTYMHHHAALKKKITVSDMEDFLVNADRAVINPEKNLHDITVTQKEVESPSFEDIVTCEEGGDEYTQACSRFRSVTLRVTPEKGHYTDKWCIGHWKSKKWGGKWYCGGCRGGDYVVDQAKKVEVVMESWSNGCDILEQHADEGLCRYLSLSKGPAETRTIQGEPVSRSHWSEHYTYVCRPHAQDQCAALKARGCQQKESTCIQTVGNMCVRWKQTYACLNKRNKTLSYTAKGKKVPFCLTGECVETGYEANTEMLDALSHLAILGEAQKDMHANVGIFRGQVRGCRKNCTSFRDCCTTGKGWGMSLHLAECSGEEKELADLREKNRCLLVGTYCAEKVLGVCVRKMTTFCCFGTKLSRLIQENGRRQLGIGFGDPKYPDCRGLTPIELSRLDFSKMDLSELLEDMRHSFNAPDTTAINHTIQERIQDNMRAMTQSLKPRSGSME